MNNPVGWFEIYVQDMARARKFYERVLGLNLERLPVPGRKMWNFPMQKNHPGAAGALVKMEGVPSGDNSTLIYFRCEDCEEKKDGEKPAGGRIHKAKFSIGEYGFISL